VYKTFERGWGGSANNELAYSRVDRLFGFGLVPSVAKVRGPEGPGILLPWIRSTEGMSPSVHRYSGLQPQMAAIDDYVMGQGGGGPLNTLTDLRHGKRGNLILIDNEHCLVRPGDPIQSDFVATHLNSPLDEKLLADLRARIHPEELRAVLTSCRIEPDRTAAAVDRLEEVLTFGSITGAAHSGPIVPASIS
jgi:hypothetical protein